MSFLRVLAIFFTCLLSTSTMYAQISKGFGTTSNTSKKPKHVRNDKDHKTKRLTHWIKNDSKGLLIGNACMDQVTHSMGFEYVVQIKGQPGNRHEFGRFMNNLGAKTAILFKNGPFWKFKLKRKRKECRRLTGDHIG